MKRMMILCVLAAACGDDPKAKQDAGVMQDAAPGSPDASCFENPQPHHEIINACTTAKKIYKAPTLPLLNQDGTLPPLP